MIADIGPSGALYALAVVLAAAIAAMGTIWVSRRTNSGSIATSDARTLWEQGRQQRADLVADIVAMRAEITDTRDELDKARSEAKLLRQEAEDARVEVGALKKVTIELRSEVARLKGQLVTFEGLDAELVSAKREYGHAATAVKDLLAWFRANGVAPPETEAIEFTTALQDETEEYGTEEE